MSKKPEIIIELSELDKMREELLDLEQVAIEEACRAEALEWRLVMALDRLTKHGINTDGI